MFRCILVVLLLCSLFASLDERNVCCTKWYNLTQYERKDHELDRYCLKNYFLLQKVFTIRSWSCKQFINMELSPLHQYSVVSPCSICSCLPLLNIQSSPLPQYSVVSPSLICSHLPFLNIQLSPLP